MRVAIEYIEWLEEERAKINKAALEFIDFFEDGMKVDIPKEVKEKFELVGLTNIDFITSGYYNSRKEE